MKTIANFASLQEAQALKLTLGSVGIEAFIPDETTAGVMPHHFMNRTGVRVQVAEEDEAAARELIKHGFDTIDPLPGEEE
jgi:hypothetical protein